MKRLILAMLLETCSLVSYSTNRALLVGIGMYPTSITGWKQINGDADIKLLASAFKARKFSDIKTLVNDKATKSAIISELEKLKERCQEGDVVYIHFSGHGQLVYDVNGDEESNFDESVIPYDANRTSRTINGQYDGHNHLIDDELMPILNKIKVKIGKTGVLCLAIDACYSRGMERGEESDIDDVDVLNSPRGTDMPFRPTGNDSYLKSLPRPGHFDNGAKMYVLTACLNTERNFEYKTSKGKMYGSLSYYVYTLLKQNADFARWANCIKNQDYKRLQLRIFQPFQHPGVEVYE